MAKIFELFGYPLAVKTLEADQTRHNAQCPFMGADCDGGGNRELSRIKLAGKPELQAFFGTRHDVAAGVCSIQLQPNEEPWIVCPRRLLVLGRTTTGVRAHQDYIESRMLHVLGYPSGTQLGVWPEVKLKIDTIVNNQAKSFDYTFDYVVMALGPMHQNDLEAVLGQPWHILRRKLEKSKYPISRNQGQDIAWDIPQGFPGIIEIMTSSTSGSNKNKRTTIPFAFEDALIHDHHEAPGINKRQVWARMVSQLIVKSEVAHAWKGRAVWLVQRNLANYIAASTGLNLPPFLSNNPSEVNLLSCSYGQQYKNPTDIIDLAASELFAGTIAPPGQVFQPSFQDMVHTPFVPPINTLIARLLEKQPSSRIMVQ